MSESLDQKVDELGLELADVKTTVTEIRDAVVPAAAQILSDSLSEGEVHDLEALLGRLARVELTGITAEQVLLLKKYLRVRARHNPSSGGMPGMVCGVSGMVCGVSGMVCGVSGMVCGATGMVCWIDDGDY